MFRPPPSSIQQGSRTIGGGFARLLPLLFLMHSSPIAAQDAAPSEGDIQHFAETLADLRDNVEGLSSDLEEKKADLNGELRNLAGQKADTEIALRREEARLEQLAQATDGVIADSRAQSAGSDALIDPLHRAIDDFKATISGGLPYRVSERLEALDTLKSQLEGGLLSVPEISSRLWQLAEDEMRLTRENMVDRQVITLDGADQLVEVARLGMVSLYFRTEGGAVGRAVQRDGGWAYQIFEGRTEKAQVNAIFDALQKQIRTGFFELPPALPEAQ